MREVDKLARDIRETRDLMGKGIIMLVLMTAGFFVFCLVGLLVLVYWQQLKTFLGIE